MAWYQLTVYFMLEEPNPQLLWSIPHYNSKFLRWPIFEQQYLVPITLLLRPTS